VIRYFNKQLLMVACMTYSAGALHAHAAEPVLDAQQLGITESVLHYCRRVDPDAATKLKEKVAKLVQGASEDALAKVRASEAYKHSYDSVSGFVAQVDEHNAKIICSDLLANDKKRR
jgi:hypothetical protein